MLRSVILAASRNAGIKKVVATAPISRNVVRRFVAGESVDDAVRVSRELTEQGLAVSLDHLGEDTTDLAHASATTKAYRTLLDRLAGEGLTAGAEVSVKLSAVGQALPGDGEKVALDHAREICAVADAAGTTVTLDMEDHTTTDSTLAILRELRRDFPRTGAVLQSYLRRTEADCRDLGSYEYQMLYGVRPVEQRRLVAAGETVRVYLPYGTEWYGYLMRRLAERPANVTFFLRALVSRS